MHVTGRFQPHPRGFGFVEPEEPVTLTTEDGASHRVDSLFVPPDLARGWLADDLVEAVAELDDRKRANAVALTLRTRPRMFVVGRLVTFAGSMVLRPDPRLGNGQLDLAPSLATRVMRAEGRQIVATVTSDDAGSAVCGSLVAGPEPVSAPSALRARAVVIAHGGAAPNLIPGGPEAIGLASAETQGNALRTTGRLAAGQTGLAAEMAADTGPVPGVELPLQDRREEVTVTIDADGTRDLDDALSAAWSGEPDAPVTIGVHIADAAGTVGMGSPADRYATTVGTTTYFVSGPNAPMLDPLLSEDELSLLPQQPRRVVTVRLEVAPDGSTSEPVIDTAWIEPDARLSYAAVDAYLVEQDSLHLAEGAHGPFGAPVGALPDVAAAVDALAEASRRLGVERDGRDTLEWLFEQATLEAVTIDGKIRAVDADPHPNAQRIVERAMVAANEAVADWAVERDLPILYRSHVGFDPDRLHQVEAAARAADVTLVHDEDGEVEPTDVLRVVTELEQQGRHDEAAAIATAATGAVARAHYTAAPSRHGGLAAGYYTHFTSPIRRFSDLVVHRQVRAALAGEELPYNAEYLERLADWLDVRTGAAGHAQALERNALWAILLDRGAVSWPTEAVVTGVSPAGLKVRLVVPGVSGFVTAARVLGVSHRDRPKLELDEHELGTADGRYRLGSRLKVSLDRVDDLGRPELKISG